MRDFLTHIKNQPGKPEKPHPFYLSPSIFRGRGITQNALLYAFITGTGRFMSTFNIIAIPFFLLGMIMLALAATQKQQTYLLLGGVFMASSLVNAVIGLSM